MRLLPTVLFSFLLVACAAAAEESASVAPEHAARMKQGLELFKKHVRPALTKHCVECHAGASVKGGFDLSSRRAMLDSGLIEKAAADSHFFHVIAHESEPHMPFKKPKLPAEMVAHIGRWIDLGAPFDKPLAEKSKQAAGEMVVTEKDRKFWSFLPLKGAAPPAVKDESWPRTPIDRFILAELEENQIAPNDAASRRTLIRRATFDLIGLAPTVEEVEAFVNDNEPRAYERLIDRLLDSPHYGERWARHWMDVARFAESHGYEQDYDRPHAYHYRDFLIKAFNADMPYDQFVRWQLAGDELAPDNPLAMTATGFLGAGVFPTQLTEAEFESARYDELDDMTATTGVAFLGLSIGCARCHDHKFDPIPTRDYYQLASTFTTTIRSEIELDVAPEANEQARREHAAKLSKLKAELKEYEANELKPAFRNWLSSYDPGQPLETWQTLTLKQIQSSGGSNYEVQDDGSALAQGTAPAKDVLTVEAAGVGTTISAIRLEALADDSLPKKGPGRADNGNFALGNFAAAAVDESGEARPVKLVDAKATHQQNTSSLSIAASIDGDEVSGWAVDGGGVGKDQAAVFELQQPLKLDPQSNLKFTLTFNHPNTRHSIGRFRLSVSSLNRPEPNVGAGGPTSEVRKALASVKQSAGESSPEWQKAIEWFASQQPKWRKLRNQIDKLEKEGPNLQLVKAQVSSEGFPHMKHHADGRGYPHFYEKTHLLKRGDVHQKVKEVSPNYLQVLMRGDYDADHWRVDRPDDWTRTSFRRASLANWLTDAQHGAGHLAARVMVNRLWHHHFGRGIVATPNDFGFQGESPTHPQLLDWLAEELIAGGWKLKRMHKLIMTSAVYMQSGEHNELSAKVDPENRLHWRRSPRRLQAEAIRDAMLQISGMLDETMYGPGTLDQSMKRRSVYFFIKRSKLIPMMMLFDWPEHLVSIGRRASTTIAPQALMFMNSPQGREFAKGLADRAMKESPDDPIGRGYALTLSRSPSEAERQAAEKFLALQAEGYRKQNATDADGLAMVDFCQTLFSLNEFLYVH